MKKCSSLGIALAALASLVLTASAQDSTDQSQFPTILQQPVDACVAMGAPVTFSVIATNAETYQWYRNNALLDGQTNSSLTLSSVSTNDVAYYFASVINGSEVVPTRSALLNVYIVKSTSTFTSPKFGAKSLSGTSSMSTMSLNDLGGGGVITVFGAPVVSSGSMGNCPGSYSGYVNYTRTISQGWGWAPTTNAAVLIAQDDNQTNTKVQAGGKFGDVFCNQTSVSVPVPSYSPKYRFAIYFPPNTQVPTNAYPITLTGFDP